MNYQGLETRVGIRKPLKEQVNQNVRLWSFHAQDTIQLTSYILEV